MSTALPLSSDLSSVPSSPSDSPLSSPTFPRAYRPSPRRSPTKTYRQIKRYTGRRKARPFDKVRETLALWRIQGLNFKEFIRLWLLSDRSHGQLGRTARIKQFCTVLEEQEIRQSIGDSLAGYYSWQRIFDELDGLSSHQYFNTFDPKTSHEWDIDSDDIRNVIETYAPEWFAFLDLLLRNCRSHEPAKRENLGKGIIGQMYMITAVACRSRKRKTSNAFAKNLGLYLISGGTKRRVVETLAGLGLCDTYKHVNDEVSETSSQLG
ncbi:hypothetical protein P152DRAFT_448004 [Eremomyces bilateralis CBS 781.70]|uniref:Uncharacterized protein n=1 Tax=Eremomyces bilateralis CBS 781.70 TaxID=1392243 RepID=A0A6G1G9Z8_9PEZI|nr:uncharacterized protein P152DRAFT_448004 [Eremomyces bilateralis CBS 781.70]KAF1814679.1 hypothetical protein P152DRAFT_448004 [Eremomyces bilateralis CBS 781.70]